MSADRDVTRIVRSWLREDAHEDADRLLDLVLDQVDTTPQRRASWLARRFPPMNNNIVRVGIAAVVVALAIVVAVKVLPGSNVGGPTATPSSIPTSTVTSTSSTRPMPADQHGALQPGTYVAGDPFSLRVTFTLPAGWLGSIGGPYLVNLGWADKPGGISFSIFDKVSADPCHSEKGYLDPPPGPTVVDLATALAKMPGIVLTDVAAASVDGYNGKQLTMAAPDSFASCTFSSFDGYVIWQLPLGTTRSMSSGERDRVWILDIAGKRLVIVVSDAPGYTSAQRAELQAVFDSIRIEPGN
jgi:hypothetical protein